MCELLGMSANVPTDIRFSFAGLARRGGGTGPHRDGWGIAFYEGRGCRAFHDPQPSADSEIAGLIRRYPIKSRTVIAHVRRANRGRVALENTHPFLRELWGRPFAFAHNGQLKGAKRLPLGAYRPIGTTDSEHAFAFMLHRLRSRYEREPAPATLDRRIAEIVAELAPMGVLNLLLSDGRTLYAFADKRLSYLTREAPFGKATLVDEDLQVDFARETTPDDVVTVIATRPLTRDETWTTIPPRTLIAFRDGRVASTYAAA
ncbi:class II glutamine amidotransferase [Salinarimonas sp.]|uniref:class II glutamine amidotransferase n=1 Tax=Salinarimonas sp. TaxID=2766526 RepID=UPI0039194D38